ncbi:hypothetical protein B7494_g4636 [Chlorociboria aeruginascens]|nr:hypothetical protein B7494_g4636 [Chlorociboria aeruginascens]
MDKPTLFSSPAPRLIPKVHARNPSRSPTRRRFTDDLLSDLSPTSTFEAFVSPSGRLKASIEAATPTDRAFGIQATLASKKIHEWVEELSSWPWPSGSAGFEIPPAKRRKLSTESNAKSQTQGGISDGPEEYTGSLPTADFLAYEVRIGEIREDMEDLKVEDIKRQVLDTHFSPRSRPSSSSSNVSMLSSFGSYTRMDDFTAVVTATVLQALPNLSKLMRLMDVWGTRLTALRKVPPLLVALDDAEIALRSGWQAIQIQTSENMEEWLSRRDFEVMRDVLQDKVTILGKDVDFLLDTLEGRQDTLPESWLDRMEAIESDYGEWSVAADRKVREGEWAIMTKDRKEKEEEAARAAEDERLREEQILRDEEVARKLEEQRLKDEAEKVAEADRLREEKRLREEWEAAELARRLEEQRLKDQAEKTAEADRFREEQKLRRELEAAETARILEEHRLEVEAEKIAEAKRLLEERRLKDEEAAKIVRQLEQQRLRDQEIEEDRWREEQRLKAWEAAQLLETQRLEEKAAEAARHLEVQREVEAKIAAEIASQREAQRLLDEESARATEIDRLQEERRLREEVIARQQAEKLQQEEALKSAEVAKQRQLDENALKAAEYAKLLHEQRPRLQKEKSTTIEAVNRLVREQGALEGSEIAREQKEDKLKRQDSFKSAQKQDTVPKDAPQAENTSNDQISESATTSPINSETAIGSASLATGLGFKPKKQHLQSTPTESGLPCAVCQLPSLDGNRDISERVPDFSNIPLKTPGMSVGSHHIDPIEATNSKIANKGPLELQYSSPISSPPLDSPTVESFNEKEGFAVNEVDEFNLEYTDVPLSDHIIVEDVNQSMSLEAGSDIEGLNTSARIEDNETSTSVQHTTELSPFSDKLPSGSLELEHQPTGPEWIVVKSVDDQEPESSFHPPIDYEDGLPSRLGYHSRNTSLASGYSISLPTPEVQDAEPAGYFRPVLSPVKSWRSDEFNEPISPLRSPLIGLNQDETSPGLFQEQPDSPISTHSIRDISPVSGVLETQEGSTQNSDVSRGDGAYESTPESFELNDVEPDIFARRASVAFARAGIKEIEIPRRHSMTLNSPNIGENLVTTISSSTIPSSPVVSPPSVRSLQPSPQIDESPSAGRVGLRNRTSLDYSPPDSPPPLPALSNLRSLQPIQPPNFSLPESNEAPGLLDNPPLLDNVDVSQKPWSSPKKISEDQMQQQISSLLQSIPARIRLTSEPDTNPPDTIHIKKTRRSITPSFRSHSSLSNRAPTPSFTLAPAYAKGNSRPRPQNGNPEIKLYHLSRSTGEAPIKLFVRLVGEHGERVMVRVGGGWADLGEYLREYASHHGRRSAPAGDDKVEIQDLPPRIVSSGSVISNSTIRPSGRNSPMPTSRPTSAMDRPVSSLAVKKTRRSIGEADHEPASRNPSTPLPAMARRPNPSIISSDTPPSATSIGSRTSSTMSWAEEDSALGLAGPRSKGKELEPKDQEWVNSMKEKVRIASAERDRGRRSLEEMDKVGATKRLFRKGI